MVRDLIKQITLFLAVGIEASAAFVIGFAAVEAMIAVFKLFFFRRNLPEEAKEELRLRLGRWLAVALEFELAADILRTAVAPTWDEIGKPAAIVVLRTVLNFFLQREIEKSATNKLLI
ncbi:DUF1622 domain-containing protein [aff. Roholtiella sp. LEGE 12411]|uniref:DUF1622 domain-containing protein n=1 Tax=aff. Roholtiella sp. LEGE 12411 TaxID=1828822 RepID=UPI001FC897B9|nr:DUF1622 domain-containing protein [aff. Roholtiella sp. LEGE 12411]